MGAPLDNASCGEDDDLVSVLDRPQTVGDHDDGPTAQQGGDRGLYFVLSLGINARGSLIEYEDRRIFE